MEKETRNKYVEKHTSLLNDEMVKKKMIDAIIKDFDFKELQVIIRIVEKGQWTPTIQELKKKARELLMEAWEERKKWNGSDEDTQGIGQGHLYVEILRDCLALTYKVGDVEFYFEDYISKKVK